MANPLVAALLPRQATDELPVPTDLPTTIGLLPTATATPPAASPTNSDNIPFGWVEQNGRIIPWWYSRTGEIVKWSIFFGLTMLISIFLIGSYVHAKRRLRKGLLPLNYHRWMISRGQLARVDPRYAYPQATYTNYHPHQEYYGMHAMPPPIYDPDAPRPPIYEPPQGATKADPSQWRTEPTRRPPEGASSDAASPPDLPPSVANQTSSSPPYRP